MAFPIYPRTPANQFLNQIISKKTLCENLKCQTSERSLHLKPFQLHFSNRDHLNTNSCATSTRDDTRLIDPLGDLSINDLDSSNILSSSGACVPGSRFNAISSLEGKEIDLAGTRDCAGETCSRDGESECQLTSRVLGLVDEGDIEGEEGVDVVVGGGGGDEACVLSSEGTVGASFFDGDDQVGGESCFGAEGGGSRFAGGGGGDDALVDSDGGGSVWRGRRVDCDCGDSSCGCGGLDWGDGDGAGGNVWLLGNTDVVNTDSCPWVATVAVRIDVAANFWWWRGKSGCGRGRDVFADAHVVDANSVEGISACAILVGYAADRWHGRSRRRSGCGGSLLSEHADVVRSAVSVLSGVSILAVFIGHAAESWGSRGYWS
jgi:hypothetical protein